MLRFFCLGDGGLALFNGGQEEQPSRLDAVFDSARRAPRHPKAPPTFRLSAVGARQDHRPDRLRQQSAERTGRAGAPLLYPLGGAPHAGTLSFELSDGYRLIVNCGAHPRLADERWRKAQRATAAHSTLTLNDRSCGEFDSEGRMTRGAGHVTVSREENPDGVWLDLTHDGYIGPFGLLVQRRLFLSTDGRDLRGEDRLVPGGGEMGYGIAPFVIRFHLHPSVQVTLAEDSPAVLMRAAGGIGACGLRRHPSPL